MRLNQPMRLLTILGLATTVAPFAARPAVSQSSAPDISANRNETAKDYYQRSLEIYEFRKAAQSGTARGEEIFYYKCWFCHNEYQKGSVQLKGLYSHPKLLSGDAVNDDSVKEKVRSGGPGMPAYKYVLKDSDLADLLSYLREKCCWNAESPPANPRYRAR